LRLPEQAMPVLILLSFGVFFICCILQFWYLKKVRDALIDRHPEAFLAAERSSIFPMQGIWKFTRGSRYKLLGDSDLNRHVRNLKRLMVIAVVAWAASLSPFSPCPSMHRGCRSRLETGRM